MSNLGTENTEAFAESLKKLAVLGKKVQEDKKVSLEDLPVLIAFLPELPAVISGFAGLGEMIKEGKDIDVSELIHLIQVINAKVKEVEQA